MDALGPRFKRNFCRSLLCAKTKRKTRALLQTRPRHAGRKTFACVYRELSSVENNVLITRALGSSRYPPTSLVFINSCLTFAPRSKSAIGTLTFDFGEISPDTLHEYTCSSKQTKQGKKVSSKTRGRSKRNRYPRSETPGVFRNRYPLSETPGVFRRSDKDQGAAQNTPRPCRFGTPSRRRLTL